MIREREHLCAFMNNQWISRESHLYRMLEYAMDAMHPSLIWLLRKPKRGTGILYQGLFKRYNNNNNIRIRIMRHQIRKGRAQYEIRQYLNSSERVLRCDTLHAAIKEIATGIETARYSFFLKVRARGWSTYCHAAHNFENAKKKMENICNFFCLDRWNIPPHSSDPHACGSNPKQEAKPTGHEFFARLPKSEGWQEGIFGADLQVSPLFHYWAWHSSKSPLASASPKRQLEKGNKSKREL